MNKTQKFIMSTILYELHAITCVACNFTCQQFLSNNEENTVCSQLIRAKSIWSFTNSSRFGHITLNMLS